MELGNRIDWIRGTEGSCLERLLVFWFEQLGGSAIQGNKNREANFDILSFYLFIYSTDVY